MHLCALLSGTVLLACIRPTPAPCNQGDLRLVGGTFPNRGRVEICLYNMWGTICDDVWGTNDALVVCRQLGFSGRRAIAYSNAFFGQGSGPILMDDVQCNGSESTLYSCPFDKHTADCRHNEDAGVRCYRSTTGCVHGDIRLTGSGSGISSTAGRVEVCLNNRWGTVCDDLWGVLDARVVCRQMGYSTSGAVALLRARFGQGNDVPILLDDLRCTGTESRLIDCPYTTIDNCTHSEDASVNCTTRCTNGDLRLTNGPFIYNGRVEVCNNNAWGTVCDDFWGTQDTRVVCKQFGFSQFYSIPRTNAFFGQGTGPILLDNVQCTGTESRLIDCPSNALGSHNCAHSEDAGVYCRIQLLCENGEIRLVGGTTELEGRVEVCWNEAWGTVCDDFWDTLDAQVACRQLGYSTTDATAIRSIASTFGLGTGPIYLENLVCNGTETRLVDCRHNGIGIHNCVHSEDAGLRCLNSTTLGCTNHTVRLAGSSNIYEGRVELCINNVWGTICDDAWNALDASVVCRQLGFSPSGAIARTFSFFGGGTGPIYLDNVACRGTESRLTDCPSFGLNNHNCGHQEDAGITCQICATGDIRLVGGQNDLEGRVEVCYQSQWGTVCDDFWGVNDATVACGQLGFSRTGAVPLSFAYFGQGTGLPIFLDNVGCIGSESRVWDCPNNGIGVHNCSHAADASVRCQNATLTCTNGDIRLRGGMNMSEGRVEICDNNMWGTVCDDLWGPLDANVACGQLGFASTGSIARFQAYFGQGTGAIILDNLMCSGTERRLVDCESNGIGLHNCDHSKDAGVTCRSCLNGDIRLRGGSNYTEGRVEICYNATWGTVCDDLWGPPDAMVACRQLGLSPNGATAVLFAQFGPGTGRILLDNVACNGSEARLINCSHNTIGVHNCIHAEDAGVRCQPLCQDGNVRLANGPTSYSGRVEICFSETWGTVCNNMWGASDASVVCRQLGFSRHNATTQSGAAFGQGSGPISLTNVGCTGNEARLVDCLSSNNTVGCTHFRDASATCVQDLLCGNGDIRLVNGTTFYEGRVEICWNETWGTVCDGLWSGFDAQVACRQLGYVPDGATPLYNAFFGQGTGPILLDDLLCTSTESRLVDCQHDGIGQFDFCRGHLDDAGVRCAESCVGDGIRLVGGTRPHEGRVEICKSNVWGTVCDDFWDNLDASVACRQLGFSGFNATALSFASFGQGAGPIHLDDVQCTGTESRLVDCRYTSVHNCIHFEDASVRCQPQRVCDNGDIRLVGSAVPRQGRVEICWNETWGTVCDGLWSTNDANVACRQLGFSRFGATPRPNAAFGQGTGIILLDDLRCSGSETRLIDCPSDGIGNSDNCNGHADDAGVVCGEAVCQDGQLRLVGGSTPYEGRVEICQLEQWGTICDSPWNDAAAIVICRQLRNSPDNAHAVTQVTFGPGSGPTVYSNVMCTGNETTITNCSYTPGGSCTDAGVICQRRRSYPDPVTITGTSSRYINITWQPPTEVYSTIVRYSITCTGRGNSVTGQTRDNTSNMFILQPLQPYTNYTCCVMTVTVRPGGSSQCVNATTMEAAPTAPATRLQATATISTVTLSWQAPPSDETNGVLRMYTVTLQQPSTGQTLVHNTTSTNITISSLTPCTNYIWNVIPYTIAYGRVSSSSSITTLPLVTGPGYEITLNPVIQSNSQASILWAVPQSVWNQSFAYIVITVESQTSSVNYNQMLTSYNTSGSFTLSGLVPFVPYQASLTAFICGRSILAARQSFYTHGENAVCQDGLIRLAGGSTSYEGRVEICQLGQWGTICDSPWNNTAAIVICRQLHNSPDNARAVTQAMFGPGSAPTVYSNVMCTGNETTITNCSYTPGGSCTDAGVICQRRRSYPDPVTIIGTGSRYINITWQPPTEVYSTIVRYSITCTGRSNNITGQTPDNTSNMFILQALQPYTNYTCCVMTVTVRPGGSSQCNHTTTMEDVPSAPATMLQGRAVNATAVQLSWQPPPVDEQNGVIRLYTVVLCESQTGQTVVYNTTMTQLTVGSLMPCMSYNWSVTPYTVGYGPVPQGYYSVNTQLIINAPGYEITVNVVPQSDDQITVFWSVPPGVQNQRLQYFDVIVEAQNTDTNQYQGEQRVFVMMGQSVYTQVFNGLVEHVRYQVNLTATLCQNTVLVGSQSVFTLERVPSVGPNITSAVRTGIDSATVTWGILPHEVAQGTVTSYSIRYRPTNTQSEPCGASNANLWTVTPKTSSSPILNIMDLGGATAYCVAVAATTGAGTGPYGIPGTIPPPDFQPSNTTGRALNSTHIYLMWEPPEDPNGDIREYRVNVTEEETGRRFQLSTNTTSIIIGSLHPYYKYNCTVVPVTNTPGPFSSVITVRTDEAAPSNSPMMLTFSNISDSSFHLVWQSLPAADQNGIIRHYVVNITEVDTGRQFQLTSVTTYTSVGSLYPFYTYVCTVAASTVDIGPFSTPLTVTTLEAVPSAPQNVTGELLNSITVRLHWDPPERPNGIITGYQVTYYGYRTTVQVQEVQGGMMQILDGPHVLNTLDYSVTLTNLNSGLTYSFKIRARTSIGYGENSTAFNITPVEGQPGGQSATQPVVIAVPVVVAVGCLIALIVMAALIWRRCKTKNKFIVTSELKETGYTNMASGDDDQEDLITAAASASENSNLACTNAEDLDAKEPDTSYL